MISDVPVDNETSMVILLISRYIDPVLDMLIEIGYTCVCRDESTYVVRTCVYIVFLKKNVD